jgi:hypothetical protein
VRKQRAAKAKAAAVCGYCKKEVVSLSGRSIGDAFLDTPSACPFVVAFLHGKRKKPPRACLLKYCAGQTLTLEEQSKVWSLAAQLDALKFLLKRRRDKARQQRAAMTVGK